MDSKQEKESAANASSDEFSVSAPKVELPKGGGAIRGIGEKFAANPVTGTGSMSVPIATSPGRAGFGPQLSLSYDSGAGNGVFGFGWNLSMPSITRKTDKGLPRYFDAEDADPSDVFILSGAEDLVPLLNMDGTRYENTTDPTYTIHRYRPRIEGLFARIESWTQKINGDVHWRSISKDNILTIYGKDSQSRIHDPEDPRRIFSWLICETRDDKGNAVVYQYKPEDGVGVTLSQVHERNRGNPDDPRRSANRYLKRIFYGNVTTALDSGQRPRFLDDIVNYDPKWMFEAVFDYGEHDDSAPKPDDLGPWVFRADPFSTYRPGFEVRTTRLCQRVLMFHHFPDDGTLIGENYDGLVRSTDFTYSHQQAPQDSRNSIYTFLQQVRQTGYKRKEGQASDYIKSSLPPVEYTYSQAIVQDTVEEVDSSSLENLPIGVDGAAYQWTDLHSEGIPGILTEQADSWWYKRNISPVSDSERPVKFTPLERVASRPNMALASGAQFMDLAGDGQLDLVMFDGPTPGFIDHDKQEGWQSFKPFKSRLNRNFQDPNLKFIDLDGDGHADVMISEDDAFIWHASLAEAGFGPAHRVAQTLDEESGPRLVFADGTQSIFLADMSGDGLTDLVRIRNDEICYWPNQGYCRFGAKISMDNAPHFDSPDQFEHSRLRVADIDGSGTADIIYLHGDGVRLHFNQSGNGWSDAQVLEVFPRVDEVVSIALADLLGNGTACLVWSSPLPGDSQHRMRYVNLMGEQKPHLLIKSKNNLGAETAMFYAPSTKFYLQDKHNRKPWVTKLPFPVHVVEKVVVTDRWRKTRFATTYSYHHGYFDGVEREFRGFGRVEQIDVETYGEFAAGNASSPYIADDKTLYQPPIKTISWFHTGAALDRERILSQYQQEYFKGTNGFEEKELPEPDLKQSDLTAGEWREAIRACKGLPLRQEVYELDVDALEKGKHRKVRLFSTAFHNCNIQMLQAQADNRHAVFLVTESEAVSYQYDLDLRPETPIPDPRISHTLNLNIDQYGNVLQSVAIVYPRLREHVDATLPNNTEALIRQVQSDAHLAYTETRFTNDVDKPADFVNYRLRLPCEVLSYELTGLSPNSDYFRLEELQELRLSKTYQNAGTEPDDLAYHETPNRIDFEKRLVEQVRMLFFEDDSGAPTFLKQPLPFGELGYLGLSFETYKLALTDLLLDEIFDANKLTPTVRAELVNADKSGYLSGATLAARFGSSEGQYWIRSGIAGFADDAAEHFFLPEEYADPFGNTSTLVFDKRDLFIVSSTDPLGNHVSVEKFDYRVLAPRETKDINNNFAEVTFDTLGLPTATAVKGKGNQGDNLLGFTDDLVNPDLDTRMAFFGPVFDPDEARNLLRNAGVRHIYDFGEQKEADGSFTYGHRPAGAVAILRERHEAQPGAGESPLQIAFEYSDGGGNVLAQISQAEAGPVPARDVNGDILVGVDGQPQMTINDVSPRWICSGLSILNNKGNPVKQYEPYFTDLHGFEHPVAMGVTPVMYYDAADRVIRTELPDGSCSRVEFSPWHVINFDQNDTVLEPGNDWFARHSAPSASVEQKRAATLAAEHANTPGTVFLDSLGRDVISVEHNRIKDAAGDLQDEKYPTFTKLDTEGKPLWIRDARGNLVMQYISPPKANNASEDTTPANSVPCYDIAGNLLFQHSMDGGDRWMITDATGQPFYAWDENENENGDLEQRRYRTLYDVLRRPLQQQFQINNEPVKVIERLVYGEDQAGDKTKNLRGQLFQHYDSSGLVTNQGFDFKGNLLEVERQLAVFTTELMIHWPDNPPLTMLEETYTQTTEYDALNRMVQHKNWHIDGRDPAIYLPKYNQRGLLLSEALTVRGQETNAIVNIDTDAKGQRTHIEYGNGTATNYQYDPKTLRLINLKTTSTPNNALLQDLHYSYDPVGNICEIRDDAQQTVFFNNAVVEPDSKYEYDALYRLVRAEGREHAVQNNTQRDNKKFVPIAAIPFPNSPDALQRYREDYQYDSVGNILSMSHQGGNVLRWKRCYQYAKDSNRLLATGKPGDLANPTDPCSPHYVINPTLSQHYDYDTHGSMLNLNNTANEFKLRWDSNDMIQKINLGGGGDAFYRYGSDKERSYKRIEKGNIIEERLYLGGMERYRRWVAGDLKEEIETHHVFDGEQRVLMVEDVMLTDNGNLDDEVLYRYQYGNHLGSVGLEVDGGGKIISYEEFHPYGTTAFSAKNSDVRAAKKRYRYTGMERDEESGLSYHSARYYLPWLGRWGSVDPAGLVDGVNLYGFVGSSPTAYKDDSGTQRQGGRRQARRSQNAQSKNHIKSLRRQQQRSQNSRHKISSRQQRKQAEQRKKAEAQFRRGIEAVEAQHLIITGGGNTVYGITGQPSRNPTIGPGAKRNHLAMNVLKMLLNLIGSSGPSDSISSDTIANYSTIRIPEGDNEYILQGSRKHQAKELGRIASPGEEIYGLYHEDNFFTPIAIALRKEELTNLVKEKRNSYRVRINDELTSELKKSIEGWQHQSAIESEAEVAFAEINGYLGEAILKARSPFENSNASGFVDVAVNLKANIQGVMLKINSAAKGQVFMMAKQAYGIDRAKEILSDFIPETRAQSNGKMFTNPPF